MQGTVRPLQNRAELLMLNFVEAARFGGGQRFVQFWTKLIPYRIIGGKARSSETISR
jgi:hypothetical protein